jgi:hypothetical protein
MYLTDSTFSRGHTGRIVSHAIYQSFAMPVIPLFGAGSFDPETTSLLASALEAAWETVRKSGSPLAADERAASTREILAKRIIESANAGERDLTTLANDALSHLTGSS